MARVFLDDVLTAEDNRFRLVVLAAHRARQLAQGEEPKVYANGSKLTVTALRELAASQVDADDLEESLIASLQRHAEVDEPEPTAEPEPATESNNDAEVPGFEQMSEEELLAGIEALVEPERREDD